MADLAASSLPQFIATAPNPVAILKQIKLQFAGHSHHTPPKNMLDRLMGVSNPEETYRAVMKLTRGDAMAVTQILSGRYFPNHPSLQLNPQPKTNINIAIWTLASKPELFPYHVSPPFFLYFFFISVLVSKWVCFCTNNLTPGQTSTRKRKFWEGKKAEYFLSKTQ